MNRSIFLLLALAAAAPAVLAPHSLKPFHDERGRFSVDLPGEPKQTEVFKPSKSKPLYILHNARVEQSFDVIYSITYSDHTEFLNTTRSTHDILEDYFHHMPDYAWGLIKVTVTHPTVQGYPALEFWGVHPHGYLIHTRLILEGMRMYEVAVASTDQEAARDESAVFDSFHLDE